MKDLSPLIECVPNFSEGRDPAIIAHIESAIQSVEAVQLLHRDMGYGANRTVLTFVGPPAAIVEAAYKAIQTAAAYIDMRSQKGEHPRMGATDVCPLIPIRGISLEETVHWANQLAEKVGKDLDIPVYLYEAAARNPVRRNLANIRSGEYEGLALKMQQADWVPDYGPTVFNPRSGATVIGARPFLIAYNVNLKTKDVEAANFIAQRVRESGYVHKIDGLIQRDESGAAIRKKGRCKGVKAIGWFIDEYGHTQVSMNVTDLDSCAVHEAFEACREIANDIGVELNGSELIGLAPLRVFLEAGQFFAEGTAWAEAELVKLAIEQLGLSVLAPFQPQKRIIEYLLKR